ncbi:MAG: sulfatase-like hydrolase/transferase, partial [Planctomycetia bacterium]
MRILSALCALLVCPLAGWTAQPVKKPNVVFILADDLGWADLSPYGSRYHDTPHLKRLAERSVRFTNYYAASPLCSPTRSSLLTGLYPARTGITAPACHVQPVQLEKRLAASGAKQRVLNADSLTRLKGEYVTLAELFKEAGYATAHFGKWHLGHGVGYEPKDQGFDVDVPHTPRAPGPGGGYFAPWKFIADAKYKGKDGEHIDGWMADRAAEYIADQKGKPFFINFWMYSVHSPWNGDEALIEQFAKTADPKAGQRNPLYAAMIKKMDDAVGKLLDALDAADDT